MTRSRLVRYAAVSFAVGILLSTAYLLFGSWVLYTPEPMWAQVLFFPGVLAGHLLYEAGCNSIPVCQVVGIGSMGVVTSIIGLGIAMIINKRQTGHPA